jgi:hypothetical protein
MLVHLLHSNLRPLLVVEQDKGPELAGIVLPFHRLDRRDLAIPIILLRHLLSFSSSSIKSSSLPFVRFDFFGAGESLAVLSCELDFRFPTLDEGSGRPPSLSK